MADNKIKSGGSTAPPELLYAMVLATSAAIENPSNIEAQATSDGLVELLMVAEQLPVPAGEKSLPMGDLIAAATGFIGLDGDNFLRDEARIIPHVHEVVLENVSAQEFLNAYMGNQFGYVFNFALSHDSNLISLTQAVVQLGRENG